MYTANLNFDNDFDEMLIGELSEYNFLINPAIGSDQIRIRYFNFKRRLIPSIPRQVLVSRELRCPHEHQKGFDLVKRKLENGENLVPHLSKNLTNLDYNDLLLNDWGIYHLHLGQNYETNGSGFIQRTGSVLFVRLDKDKALLINVLPHGSWTKQQMVKVIHDNWPESIENYLMKDIIGLYQAPTDNDIKIRRKFGVNSSIEVETGVAYTYIGGGLTTAKTSIEVADALVNWSRLLRKLQNHTEQNLQEIGEIITKKTERKDEELLLKLIIQGMEYYAFEQNTKLAFKIGNGDAI